MSLHTVSAAFQHVKEWNECNILFDQQWKNIAAFKLLVTIFYRSISRDHYWSVKKTTYVIILPFV